MRACSLFDGSLLVMVNPRIDSVVVASPNAGVRKYVHTYLRTYDVASVFKGRVEGLCCVACVLMNMIKVYSYIYTRIFIYRGMYTSIYTYRCRPHSLIGEIGGSDRILYNELDESLLPLACDVSVPPLID
jgi:hypothetical protein